MSKVSNHTFRVNAGDQQYVGISGDYIYVKNTNGDVRIEVNNRVDVVMAKGDKLRVPAPRGELHGFSSFRIINESLVDVYITAIIGSGDFSESSISNDVDVSKSNTIDTITDQTVSPTSRQLVVAGDTTRRVIMLCNLSNTTTLRVGDDAIGQNRGQPLAPGLTLTLETTAPIYVYNPSGANILVSVTTLND